MFSLSGRPVATVLSTKGIEIPTKITYNPGICPLILFYHTLRPCVIFYHVFTPGRDMKGVNMSVRASKQTNEKLSNYSHSKKVGETK